VNRSLILLLKRFLKEAIREAKPLKEARPLKEAAGAPYA
jgi:hypothetical protein